MSIADKILEIKDYFVDCHVAAEVYEKLIELGRRASPLPEEEKRDERLVPGCQSRLYLVATPNGDQLELRAEADALISNGLAQLLLWAYGGQRAEEIVSHDALFLKELAIPTSLSPGRANGLANLLIRIKQEALQLLVMNEDSRARVDCT